MRRILRGVRHGEKGFTMIELLIVIAILGILAAVVVPNLAGFIGAGNAAAANQEVAAVETAAMAYYAEQSPAAWPANSTALSAGGYLSGPPIYAVYSFTPYGKVTGITTSLIGNLTWNDSAHKWER